MTITTLPALPGHLVEPLERHAFAETSREVGGILVGNLTNGGAVIDAFIPALKAVGAATHVTFTHDVWADVLATVEEKHPGGQIVGWYHTHPAFGVFLSEYDLFIHRNFFSDTRMLALVIDPVAGEMAWFGWKGDDIAELARTRTQRPPIEHAVDVRAREARSRARRGRLVLGAACLGIGLVTAGFIAGTRATDRADETARAAGRIAEQEQQIRTLTDALERATGEAVAPPTPDAPGHAAAEQEPVALVTVVRAGDSWWALAERFYGDGARYPEIAAANPGIVGLDPGDRVLIPNLVPHRGE